MAESKYAGVASVGSGFVSVRVSECKRLSMSGKCVCACVYMCVCMHECGCVCMSVPVSMSIQVLCERVCISVDMSMIERGHLCMCIFELTGGGCALEKPQSS